jgi:hypothetical protein
MQKTVSHKVFSIALALLVLLSTFSFKMETHFCGSKMVDVAVFSKVKSCCQVAVKTSTDLQFTKKSCCSNKVISVDGLKQFKVVSFSEELPIEKDFKLPSKLYFELAFFISSIQDFYHNYTPPFKELDFQIQHQVFLI